MIPPMRVKTESITTGSHRPTPTVVPQTPTEQPLAPKRRKAGRSAKMEVLEGQGFNGSIKTSVLDAKGNGTQKSVSEQNSTDQEFLMEDGDEEEEGTGKYTPKVRSCPYDKDGEGIGQKHEKIVNKDEDIDHDDDDSEDDDDDDFFRRTKSNMLRRPIKRIRHVEKETIQMNHEENIEVTGKKRKLSSPEACTLTVGNQEIIEVGEPMAMDNQRDHPSKKKSATATMNEMNDQECTIISSRSPSPPPSQSAPSGFGSFFGDKILSFKNEVIQSYEKEKEEEVVVCVSEEDEDKEGGESCAFGSDNRDEEVVFADKDEGGG
ncbi:hypothetical protein BJ684DRAFT_17550 [Piptocephalis cylindrospora]|uniref:Uncharacterized protein n=1 Tax=Piptocephalis cylindrospora TaxID=1907219 RepID=A0A4P9Y1H0_9FUNG|nr:hypothetical protein BJ684DRAFT_17550 [Piptocephalis cylindrospora]|eukprot:RKP11911.1 hypothetical protein BJ684DRAFT_17550 [Piptocephalis cylindrospora]